MKPCRRVWLRGFGKYLISLKTTTHSAAAFIWTAKPWINTRSNNKCHQVKLFGFVHFNSISIILSAQPEILVALLGLKSEFQWSLGRRPHRSIRTAPAPLRFFWFWLIDRRHFPSVSSLRQATWAYTNIPDHLSVKLSPSWGSSSSSHLVIPSYIIPGKQTGCCFFPLADFAHVKHEL